MTTEQAKQELVRRYKYLYENATLILAPFMYKSQPEGFIYLKINLLDDINFLFEEFLLSDKPMEKSSLYKMIERKKNEKEYLEKVKKGLELVEENNKDKIDEFQLTWFGIKLDLYQILKLVSKYIDEQSGDLDNKKNKLYVIDQYYRILRYNNDGKIYKSGRNLTLDESWGGIIVEPKRKPIREKKDIGVGKNSFITAIKTCQYHEINWSIFTEREKQEIYLQYHDELPCDLKTTCTLEDQYIETPIDSRLTRPPHTNPCGNLFTIKEEDIFIDSDDELYRYYHLCPHCGYIVNIPKEILSEGIKQRIEDRCNQDNMLFRKYYLYSEQFSLDKNSTPGQRRLLKKDTN